MGLLEDTLAELPDAPATTAGGEDDILSSVLSTLPDAEPPTATGKPDFYKTGVTPDAPISPILEGLKGAGKAVLSKIPLSTVLSPVETMPVGQREYGDSAMGKMANVIAPHEETLGGLATAFSGGLVAKSGGVAGFGAFGFTQKIADMVKEKKKEALAAGLPEPSTFDIVPEMGGRELLRATVAGAFSAGGAKLGQVASKSMSSSIANMVEKETSLLLSSEVARKALKIGASYVGAEAAIDAVSSAVEVTIDNAITGNTMTREEKIRNFVFNLGVSLVSNAAGTASDLPREMAGAVVGAQINAAIKANLDVTKTKPDMDAPIDQPTTAKNFVDPIGEGDADIIDVPLVEKRDLTLGTAEGDVAPNFKMAEEPSELTNNTPDTPVAEDVPDEKLQPAKKVEDVKKKKPQEVKQKNSISRPNASLPTSLERGKPRYGRGSNNIELKFANDVDRASYIIANAKTKSKRHEEYMKWLEHSMGWTPEEARAHGNTVKQWIAEKSVKFTDKGKPLNVPSQKKKLIARKSTDLVDPESGDVITKKPLEGSKWKKDGVAKLGEQEVRIISVDKEGATAQVIMPGDQKPRTVGVDALTDVPPVAEKVSNAQEFASDGPPTGIGKRQEGDGGTPPPPLPPTTSGTPDDMGPNKASFNTVDETAPVLDSTKKTTWRDRIFDFPLTKWLNRSQALAHLSGDNRVVQGTTEIYKANSLKRHLDERSQKMIRAITHELDASEQELAMRIAGKDIDPAMIKDHPKAAQIIKSGEMARKLFDDTRADYIKMKKEELQIKYRDEHGAMFDFKERGILPGSDEAKVELDARDIDPESYQEFLNKYAELDSWGFDNFVTTIETGPYAIVAHYTDPSGNQLKQTIGYAGKMELDERIKAMQAAPEDFPFVGKNVRFEITNAERAPNPSKQRKDILLGTGDLSKRLTAYTRYMNKRIAFTPMDAYVKDTVTKLRSEGDKRWADFLEMENKSVHNQYHAIDRFLDDTIKWISRDKIGDGATAKGAAKVMKGAAIGQFAGDLGNPITQSLSDLVHVMTTFGQFGWVKGQEGFGRALRDYASRSPEYKKHVETYGYLLGRSFHADIEGHTQGSYRDGPIETIALGGITMPSNQLKQFLHYGLTKQFESLGMSHIDAIDKALDSTIMALSIDDISIAGHLYRNTPGRLAGFMRRYTVHEMEFLSTLTTKQKAFHLGAHMALFGPSIYISFLKSIPLLNIPDVWGDSLDEAEEIWESKIGNMAYGAMGLTGFDWSTAASMRLPESVEDSGYFAMQNAAKLLALAAADVSNEMGLSNTPISYEKDWEDAIGKNVRIWRRMNEMIDQSVSPDGYVLDGQGRKVYKIKTWQDKWSPLIAPTVRESKEDTVFYNNERNMEKYKQVEDAYLDQALIELAQGGISKDTMQGLTGAYRSMGDIGQKLEARMISAELPRNIQQLMRANNIDMKQKIAAAINQAP